MPDVHFFGELGADRRQSVVPTEGAIIPSAVGVDIGCGMMAVQTDLGREPLPDSASQRLRSTIEKFIPHGRSSKRRRG